MYVKIVFSAIPDQSKFASLSCVGKTIWCYLCTNFIAIIPCKGCLLYRTATDWIPGQM